MKLYGTKTFETTKLLIAARYAQVRLEVEYVDSKHPVCENAPLKQPPILETSKGHLPGSGAILRYFGALRADLALLGKSQFEEALVDQWLDFGLNELGPRVVVLTHSIPEWSAKDYAAVEDHVKKELPPILRAMDGHLKSRTYLVGERITIADISLACILVDMFRSVFDRTTRTQTIPNIFRWFMTCVNQVPFKAVLGDTQLSSLVVKHDSKRQRIGTPRKPTKQQGGGKAQGKRSKLAPSGGGAGSGAGEGAGASGQEGTIAGAEGKFELEFNGKFGRGRSTVRQLLQSGKSLAGTSVVARGWARTIRPAMKGQMLFVALNDGSCFGNLQCLVEKDRTEGFEEVNKAGGTGSSFEFHGTIVESIAKGQEIELKADKAIVFGTIADPAKYPMSKTRHNMETLREFQHLRMRSNVIGAVTRVRNALAYATHKFHQERGFMYIHTPLISTSDCEGAGEMFGVTNMLPKDPKGDLPRTKDGSIDYSKDFFGQQSYLTVSGQLQVESFACSMSNVYTFGPTFRAENSHTSRHLAEFWMIEPEIAFADLEDNMDLVEDYIKYCTKFALTHCSEDLQFFDQRIEKGLIKRLEHVVNSEFKRVSYTEAMKILTTPKIMSKAKFEEKPFWGMDMASEHERYLTEKHFKQPIIVTDYPKDIKAFYMKLNEDGKTVRAMDVLVPKIGELAGGSQREHRIDVLEARMDECGVAKEHLQWYLDLRRYGTVPHSGFGVGFERLIMYVTGMTHIRDVIPFPRYPGHAAVQC